MLFTALSLRLHALFCHSNSLLYHEAFYHYVLVCFVELTRLVRQYCRPISSTLKIIFGFSVQEPVLPDEQHGSLSPCGSVLLHHRYGGYQWIVLVFSLMCGYQHNHFHRIIQLLTHRGESGKLRFQYGKMFPYILQTSTTHVQ